MEYLINKYKDPNAFWNRIKQVKGNQSNTTPYIVHNNEKYIKKNKRRNI